MGNRAKVKIELRSVNVPKDIHTLCGEIVDTINARQLKNEDGFPVRVNIGDVCSIAVAEYAKKFNGEIKK